MKKGGQVDYQQLMDWAFNKFNNQERIRAVVSENHKEETIIALQSQVNTLMSQRTPYLTGRLNDGGKSKQGNYKRGKGKGKPRIDNPPTWMTVPPKNGENHDKTAEGKDYHWCSNHNRWTRHSSECRGIGFKATSLLIPTIPA